MPVPIGDPSPNFAANVQEALRQAVELRAMLQGLPSSAHVYYTGNSGTSRTQPLERQLYLTAEELGLVLDDIILLLAATEEGLTVTANDVANTNEEAAEAMRALTALVGDAALQAEELQAQEQDQQTGEDDVTPGNPKNDF